MKTKEGRVIAIDGPAGTGKSSVTQRLCSELKYVHIDTGAIYRAVGLYCLRRQVFGPTLSEIGELDQKKANEAIAIAKEIHIEFKRDESRNPANRLWVNSEDVTDQIRTPEVSMAASKVGAIAGVRAALLGLQRHLGCRSNSILEGRDIGTVVFPDAEVKFFLTASVDERAKRRLAELEASGADVPSFEAVKSQMKERDELDSSRQTAPLKKADDAIEIDTTSLSLDEVVRKMSQIILEK